MVRLIGSILGGTPNRAVKSVDWKDLRQLVPANVVPYLAYQMAANDMTLPNSAKVWLDDARRAAAIKHLACMHTVRALSSKLTDHDVSFVWLKGVALGQLVYPDPTLRPMQDLDLWVEPDDVAVAQRAVADLGLMPLDRLVLGGQAAFADRGYTTAGPARVLVELHPLPSSLGDVSAALRTAMFERRVEIPSVAGGYALAPGDAIVHLCLHVTRHHRFALGLLPLLDLGLCFKAWGDAIDWDEWVSDAKAIGGASIWLPLTLSQQYLGTEVPSEVLRALTPDRHAGDLVELAEGQMVSMQEFPAGLEALAGGWSEFRKWLSRARVNMASKEAGPGRVLREKFAEYRRRAATEQIPTRGLVGAVRRAKARSRLRVLLERSDAD